MRMKKKTLPQCMHWRIQGDAWDVRPHPNLHPRSNFLHFHVEQKNWPQECIPVGHVLSAALAVSPPMHTPPPPATNAPCHACPPATHPHHACACHAFSTLCHACPFLPHMPPATHILLRHACPLWTDFLTHACENITFLQLHLRTVKIS